MKRRSRDIEIFNLSFLDVLSCGLGAVIILFLISQQVRSKEKEAKKDKRRIETVRQRLAQAEEDARRAREEEQRLREVLRELEKKAKPDRKGVAKLRERLQELRKFKFLGLETRRRNIVFLIDLSKSMWRHRDVVQRTIRTLLAQMRWDEEGRHRINVMTFQWLPGEGAIVKSCWNDRRAHEATARNRQLAGAFVDRVLGDIDGGSPTVAGFRAAFQIKDVECVFLLTDGEPMDGDLTPELRRKRESNPERLEALRRQIHKMKAKEVEIRCIGLGQVYRRPSFLEFLKKLAAPAERGFIAL